MSRNWTDAQKAAIDARGGTVLVSAAAGSGKTAVLVERVISRLTGENPCSADSLLIVTFTKAAANEMRSRISAAIESRLAEDPTNQLLLRQKLLLHSAKICTIDSFCGDFVRENFHAAGVSPDYRILDSSESRIIGNSILADIFEEQYASGNTDFENLNLLFGKNGNDEALANQILKIYNHVCACAFPEKWYEDILSLYNPDCEIDKHPWLCEILRKVKETAEYCRDIINNSLSLMEGDDLYDKYSPSHFAVLSYLEKIEKACDDGWDETLNSVKNFAAPTIGRAPKGYSSPLKERITVNYKAVKDLIGGLIKYMPVTVEEFKADLAAQRPFAELLISLTKDYAERFFLAKKEKEAYDFSDIEHLTIKLLVEEKDGKIHKTQLAEEYGNKFTEIMLDEYQDTNSAQDMIFRAISQNGENLFMVGDVKQSIYRFRQAMPEIFINLKETFNLYNGKDYPAKIILDRNFRSRAGVTESINLVFKKLMSREAGELEYGEEEALKAEAVYPEINDAQCELHLLERKGRVSAAPMEAEYIASYIKNAVESGNTYVTENGTLRKARYGDFCILMRSTKNNGAIYSERLKNKGIPVYVDLKGGLFETREVSDVISYLKAIDNPVKDIPLAAVMMSPIYGFTPDEMAEIRMTERYAPLYTAVLKAAETGLKKAQEFTSDLRKFRRLAAAAPSDDLIRTILEATGYMTAVKAMNGGEQRCANLLMLISYAERFEKSGYKGVSGFVRFIESIKDSDSDFSAASTISENADVVRIMTIHGSKGLEFPICILANCGVSFGGRNADPVVLSSSLGIGMKLRDSQKGMVFDTAGYEAVRLANKRADVAEEMRVLYVAMTRAKEKIVMTGTVSNIEKAILSATVSGENFEKLPVQGVVNSGNFLSWIIPPLAFHPDCGEIRKIACFSNRCIDVAFSIKLRMSYEDEETAEQSQQNEENCCVSSTIMEEIKERAEYEYPYEPLSKVAVKLSASHLEEEKPDYDFFCSSRPAFLEKKGLTPAQKGTATHKFMQFCDFEKAKENASEEILRLKSKGFLSEAESEGVELEKIEKFFSGNLAKRIFSSDLFMREYKFVTEVSAEEYNPELPENLKDEKIVIQGIADCVFSENGEAVLVDYKTDRVSSPKKLIELYRNQLKVYKQAIEKSLEISVKEVLLYSFHLGEEIEVNI